MVYSVARAWAVGLAGCLLLLPVGRVNAQTEQVQTPASVTSDRLLNPRAGEWLMHGREYNGHHYSPLRQITRQTVTDWFHGGCSSSRCRAWAGSRPSPL